MSTSVSFASAAGRRLRSVSVQAWRSGLAVSVFGAAVLLAACGGGGEGGTTPASTSSTPAAAADDSSYALGAVSGFGSVIVGGIRYDDSRASVVNSSGTVLPLSAIKLGSLVTVEGSKVDRSTGTGVADRFRICDDLLGPVASIDSAGSKFVVLGQTVVVNASTVFDSTLSGGLSALTAGAVVEVHGTPDATTGQITATRVEAKTGVTAYQLRGTVAALDATAKTFKIGEALVSYAGLAAADVPSTLANGLVVRTVLNTTPSNGAWVATVLRSDVRNTPASSSDSHIEGAITVFTSSVSFEVGGVKVDASKASFPDGTTGIVLGARVEVTGAIASGVLVATKVELEDKSGHGGQRPIQLHGALSALDTTAKTFTLRSVTVSYGGTVTFSGGTVADLANGKNLSVYGVLSSDRTKLDAQRIVFKP